MVDADRAAFAEALAGVYELYGRSDRLSAEVLEMWWEAMRAFDLRAVREALGRHAMNPDHGQFIPKPADVVRELGGTSADASMLAFARVVRALRDVGTLESVTFDDPITNRVLRDLGGWAWLGEQKTAEMPFIEKRFRDAYRAHRARGLDGDPVTHLAGRIELSNAALPGVKIDPPRLVGDRAAAAAIAGVEQGQKRIEGRGP